MDVRITTPLGGVFILTDAWILGSAIVGTCGGHEMIVRDEDYAEAVAL